MFKILILLIVCLNTQCYLSKNVCSTLADYNTMSSSANCWHNPNVGSTPIAIANRYGYAIESHFTITDDGYKLGLFRICSKNKCSNGSVVFLQHGILETAMCWLSLDKQSLAFELSNVGFDVWLGNFRGTIYSNEHIKHSNISSEKYWDFSFFELGYYDLSAMLEYIVKTTKINKKIIYIGHSLGATASYVYYITRKVEAHERLSALISVAPAAYMKHTHAQFNLLVSLSSYILSWSKLTNIFALGISTTQGKTAFYKLCLYGVSTNLCRFIAQLFFVSVFGSLAPEMLPIVLTQAPAATSLKVLRQFSQEILNNGQFQAFDYGDSNQKIYGNITPPIFDITQIDIPVYLFYGKNDKVATEPDIRYLYNNLKTVKYILPVGTNDGAEFGHTDFIFNRKIEQFYRQLFEILKNLTSIN